MIDFRSRSSIKLQFPPTLSKVSVLLGIIYTGVTDVESPRSRFMCRLILGSILHQTAAIFTLKESFINCSQQMDVQLKAAMLSDRSWSSSRYKDR